MSSKAPFKPPEVSPNRRKGFVHLAADLVVGLYLAVEEAELLDGRVAVHGPGEQVARPTASLVRRAEHRGRRTTVHLDVLPAKAND